LGGRGIGTNNDEETHLSNTTGGDKVFSTPWTTDRMLKMSNAVPAVNTTFYAGQAVGRDGSGNMVQMDDTAKAEFVGILVDAVRTTVLSDDAVGDKLFMTEQPQQFTAKISGAAAGDEGRKVYWLYNNEVSYSAGASGNLAGHVWHVKDSTHVTVLPPWITHATAGGDKAVISRAATGTATLTKFDANKVVLMPLTSSATTTLPSAATLSPGDRITLVNTSANSSTPTVAPAGSDTINGAASYTQSTTQYATAVFRTDGSSKWYVEVPGPSGTVGATTFSGAVGVNAALVVTDNEAASFAVGRLGATTPAFVVDASTASSITGVSVKSAASGGGVTVAAVGETNVAVLLDAKGSGTLTLNSVATGNVVLGRAATGVSLAVTAGLTSSGPTGAGVGYAAGAGGAVTQATSRTTGVTVNTLCGAITTDTSSLAAGAEAEFTVTNSTVAATDVVVVCLKTESATGTSIPFVSTVAAGSFKITLSNLHASTADTSASVVSFAVVKAVAS
jgi:hypothetical protein